MIITNKRVILRVDFNVPITDGIISDCSRITAAIPTILDLLSSDNTIILLSHLGRPTPGQYDEKYSLKIVSKKLAELLKQPVVLRKILI